MDLLPHEYLKSYIKEDIKIIFEIRDHVPIVILRYRMGIKIIEYSARIMDRSRIGDIIQDAEIELRAKLREE